MLAEKKTNTNIGVGLGTVLQLAGFGPPTLGGSMPTLGVLVPLHTLGVLVSFAGMALFLWGCVSYAQGKGYSGFLGLLGLLSCLGLTIMIAYPTSTNDGRLGHSASSG